MDLKPNHRKLVQEILRKRLSASSRVWVFGSRATGKSKPYSDLDLAIDQDTPMPFSLSAALSLDFEESHLPFKVDIVDLKSISEEFRRRIENDKIPFC